MKERLGQHVAATPLLRILLQYYFLPFSTTFIPHLDKNFHCVLHWQAHEVALDLAALNIQRGRDHGLPDYNTWRKYCNLSTPNTIEGLREHISNTTVLGRLRDIYGDNPSNIDLFVGGLLEDTLPGSQLGPTFRCIIGDQFKRSRDGDRYSDHNL